MKLNRVTITGADDDVRIADLVALSEEFPFVEWGILFSQSAAGTARYPSIRWADQFTSPEFTHRMQLSAHLCGSYARNVMSGYGGIFAATFMPAFDRVQINGWTPTKEFNRHCTGMQHMADPYVEPKTFILQVRDLESMQAAWQTEQVHRINAEALYVDLVHQPHVALYDPSGGQGLTVDDWPEPFEGLEMGYAGGIRPDTVRAVLGKLSAMSADCSYWIDMETGVRTDNRFDLAKVREVLTIAKGYVHESE